MLKPANACNLTTRNLQLLFKRFPKLKDSCDPFPAENEWKGQAMLGISVFENCGLETESQIATFGVENYWCYVLHLRNSATKVCYQNLRKCISLLF